MILFSLPFLSLGVRGSGRPAQFHISWKCRHRAGAIREVTQPCGPWGETPMVLEGSMAGLLPWCDYSSSLRIASAVLQRLQSF